MEIVPFKTLKNGNEILFNPRGYALPCDVFTFIADFAASPNYVSDKSVVWGFGDGTFSEQLTASHSYSTPGIYNVTLTIFLSTGDGTQSTWLSSIPIDAFVRDEIVVSTNQSLTMTSGQPLPLYITRYNSVHSSLSSSTIYLSVSGNRSPLVSEHLYYLDKHSHLKPSAKFMIKESGGYKVVDKIVTTNDPLYVMHSNGTYTTMFSADENAYFAGTSGIALVYYVEDHKI